MFGLLNVTFQKTILAIRNNASLYKACHNVVKHLSTQHHNWKRQNTNSISKLTDTTKQIMNDDAQFGICFLTFDININFGY